MHLAVEVHDLAAARKLAKRLKEDPAFYERCSRESKENYKNFYSVEIWKQKMKKLLNNI
jgi:hypothetical protein